MPRTDTHPDPHAWLVFTDGSCRHAKRQSFCGWAARAVQPATRQFRQVTGAGPGSDSLRAELDAVVEGLRLVPVGATAILYCDLDPAPLLQFLHGDEGRAARAHLHEVHFTSVIRNSGRDGTAMHRLASATEDDAREDPTPDGNTLPNAIQEALATAQISQPDAGQTRQTLPPAHGETGPLSVHVTVTPQDATPDGVRLSVRLPDTRGHGRTPTDATRDALRRILRPLARSTLVHLNVPTELLDAARDVTPEFPTVRIVMEDPEGEGSRG